MAARNGGPYSVMAPGQWGHSMEGHAPSWPRGEVLAIEAHNTDATERVPPR